MRQGGAPLTLTDTDTENERPIDREWDRDWEWEWIQAYLEGHGQRGWPVRPSTALNIFPTRGLKAPVGIDGEYISSWNNKTFSSTGPLARSLPQTWIARRTATSALPALHTLHTLSTCCLGTLRRSKLHQLDGLDVSCQGAKLGHPGASFRCGRTVFAKTKGAVFPARLQISLLVSVGVLCVQWIFIHC